MRAQAWTGEREGAPGMTWVEGRRFTDGAPQVPLHLYSKDPEAVGRVLRETIILTQDPAGEVTHHDCSEGAGLLPGPEPLRPLTY